MINQTNYLFSIILKKDNIAAGNTNFIENAIGLTAQLKDTWVTIWKDVILNPNSPIWIACLETGITLALIGIAIASVKIFKKAVLEPEEYIQEIVQKLFTVLVIVILFGNNGYGILSIAGTLKGIEFTTIEKFNNITVEGLSLQSAAETFVISAAQKAEIENILNTCNGKQGDTYLKCLEEIRPEIEAIGSDPDVSEIVQDMTKDVLSFIKGSLTGDLDTVVDGIKNVTGATIVSFTTMGLIDDIIKILMLGLMGVFTISLEIASMLHTLILPIIIGFCFTELGANMLGKWLEGFYIIAVTKLYYTTCIGLGSAVAILSSTNLVLEITFMLFFGFGSPLLCVAMANGGGSSLSQATGKIAQEKYGQMIQTGVNAISSGAGQLGKLAGSKY